MNTYRAAYSTHVGWWYVEEQGRPICWCPAETYARAIAQALNAWYWICSTPYAFILKHQPRKPELN